MAPGDLTCFYTAQLRCWGGGVGGRDLNPTFSHINQDAAAPGWMA